MKSVNTKLVISELHRAFKLFNENLFDGELPEPAILIQSRGNKKLTLGWCTVKQVWKNEMTKEEKYEINLVAEGLNRGIYPVMTTLLHEMVHLHNLVNNIKDVSRSNTYHNMKFKKVAEAHGLLVEHADKIGWSLSKLQGLTMDLIDMNHFDEAVFSFGRIDLDFDDAGKPRKKKKTSSRKYICPNCGGTVRTSKDMNILCGDCTNIEKGIVVAFVKVEEPDEEGAEGTETDGAEGTEEIMVEYICKECGAVSLIPEDADRICPECGCCEADEDAEEEPETPVYPKLVSFECKHCGEPNMHPAERGLTCQFCGKHQEEAEEKEAETTPAGIVEVETKLNDGAGNMIPVKQRAFDVEADNTGWTVERIMEELKGASIQFKGLGFKNAPAVEGLNIEITEKMVSQWALYKEGKGINFSKNYMETASDSDIIDTIKHQYIHHYQFTVEGLKSNHKKEFKKMCELMEISTEIPTKNHRAMK